MTPEQRVATRAAGLSREKQQALLRMQPQVRNSAFDILSAAEISRLRFVRLLYQSGRLTS